MTKFARVDFDTIAPLMPFDKTASQVSARGVSFEWQPEPHVTHRGDPIPYRAPTADDLAKPEYRNLTGAKIGRLTVLGVSAEPQSSNGQRWVVRCVCGSYELRRAKAIKKALDGGWTGDDPPMCDCCMYTQKLRAGRFNAKKAAAAEQAIQEMSR